MKCSGLRAFMLTVAALTFSGPPAGAYSLACARCRRPNVE
jgi:hypothetical protein